MAGVFFFLISIRIFLFFIINLYQIAMDFFPLLSFLLLVFLLSVRIVSLKQKGIRVGSGAGKSPRGRILLYVAFLLVLFVFLIELVKLALEFPFNILPELFTEPLTDSVVLTSLGFIIITVSIILFLYALADFKYSLRFGLDKKNQGELITSGIFMFSRNPFFLSLDLYFTGLALYSPCLFFIVLAVLTVVIIHFFILKEEKFLLKVHGGKYRDYRKKVRRYF